MVGRVRTRFAVVGAIVAALVAVLSVSAVRADPTPALPAVDAASLLASTLGALAGPVTISGTVASHVDLGVPELPSSLGGGLAGPVAQILGDQRFLVWRSPDGVRVARRTDLSEQVLVADHTDAWLWNSDTFAAAHLTAAEARSLRQQVRQRVGGRWDPGALTGPAGAMSHADVTAAADRALRALAPYADVSVDGTARVAGRTAYDLTLTPRSSVTMIGRITVAIDAETRLPLRLQVFAGGADRPAIEVGFTSVSYDPIDPAMFTFTPPPGASVTEAPGRLPGDLPSALPRDPGLRPRRFGEGFATRVAIPLQGRMPSEAALLLPFQGTLGSAMTTEVDGHPWLLIGPVPLEVLRQDAATL